MIFKCLIIKKLFIKKRDSLAPSNTLLPPKKTEDKWAQNKVHLQFASTAKCWPLGKTAFHLNWRSPDVDRITGINSLAAQVKIGLSSYRFLSLQDLLEPGRPCTKQQKKNMTPSNHEGSWGVALGCNQVSSLSFLINNSSKILSFSKISDAFQQLRGFVSLKGQSRQTNFSKIQIQVIKVYACKL